MKLTAHDLSLDTLSEVFYRGDIIVQAHDDYLRNAVHLVLMTVASGPLRVILVAGRKVSTDDIVKVFSLSQFVGACETIMAGCHMLRGGYPHEVPSVCRRAFEAGALALYYIDNPGQWMTQVSPVKIDEERVASYRSPPVGKAVDSFVRRVGNTTDASGVKHIYSTMSQHAHSGPGVRAHANYINVDTLRLGPLNALDDDGPFKHQIDLLELTAKALHGMCTFAYQAEIEQCEEGGDIPELK